jgi:hypothetical protein
LLGDNVTYDEPTNTYTSLVEADSGFVAQHSPIIGWAKDGLPIYGPFGYDDPYDPESGVRRMVTGFQLRDGSNGSTNLDVTGRTTLPQWCNDLFGRTLNLSASFYGPDTDQVSVTEDYSLGQYIEDYAYKGDLGLTQGVHFDLDVHNVRYCVTPEFPNGTYAYFNTLDATGAEEFPYNVGVAFYGEPNGSEPNSISESVTTWFQGGEHKQETSAGLTFPETDTITLTYNVVEGGTYIAEVSTDLSSGFTPDGVPTVAESDVLSFEYTGLGDSFFHRITRDSLADYDGAGGSSSTVEYDFTFSTTPPLPPENAIDTVTVGGGSATIVSYDQGTGAVRLSFDPSSLSGANSAQMQFEPTPGNVITVTSTNTYTAP